MFFSFICSEEAELKIWKFLPFASQNILITDNFEVWELNYLTPNKQSWNEWIWGTDLEDVPPAFLFNNREWVEDSLVTVIDSPWSGSPESFIYRNNSSFLAQLTAGYLSLCTHVLLNKTTGEKVFARRLDLEEWKMVCSNFAGTMGSLEKARHPYAAKYLEAAYILADFGLEMLNELQSMYRFEPYDSKMVQFAEFFPYHEGVWILIE